MLAALQSFGSAPSSLAAGRVGVEALQVVAKCPRVEDAEQDFELWVETDLSVGWCLESGAGCQGWKDRCSTATVRRRWEEFEALGKSSSLEGMSLREALAVLGLEEGATAGSVASTFRQLCRKCHPDKVGGDGAEGFNRLAEAYQVARASLGNL